jgi:hypothetical protein
MWRPAHAAARNFGGCARYPAQVLTGIGGVPSNFGKLFLLAALVQKRLLFSIASVTLRWASR